ncbi:unnamed protein product [Camellia sinensis]
MSCWLNLIDGSKMALEVVNPHEEVVLGEEIDHVQMINLNQPRQLNVISSKVLVLIKGAGRAFFAGRDLKCSMMAGT